MSSSYIDRLIVWFSGEGHRGYLYRVGLAAVALCIVLGLLSNDVAGKVILLVAAVLGLGGNGLATVNTAVGAKLRKRNDREMDRLQAVVDVEKAKAEEKGFQLGKRARPAEAERVSYGKLNGEQGDLEVPPTP